MPALELNDYPFFLTADFFTESVLALEVSVFVESPFAEALIDEESTFVESPALSALLPLHEATNNKTVIANKVTLNEFFITLIFKLLIINKNP
jgi:hypothetical protein